MAETTKTRAGGRSYESTTDAAPAAALADIDKGAAADPRDPKIPSNIKKLSYARRLHLMLKYLDCLDGDEIARWEDDGAAFRFRESPFPIFKKFLGMFNVCKGDTVGSFVKNLNNYGFSVEQKENEVKIAKLQDENGVILFRRDSSPEDLDMIRSKPKKRGMERSEPEGVEK